MNTPIPAEIIRCLRHDGFNLADGAAYCRRIALQARLGAYTRKEDAAAYTEAAERLEAQAKAERLALERVEALEEENRHLARRVLELEQAIVSLTHETKPC
jgi:hypothetical protein